MNSADARVAADDRLLLHYTISCKGVELESSELDAPVEYRMGQGMWPVQIELAMLNELVGSVLDIKIGAADGAFGMADPGRILRLQREDFMHDPAVGELIEFEMPDGEQLEGQVLSLFPDQIEVDFNHPYVGRDLDIHITIENIIIAEGG